MRLCSCNQEYPIYVMKYGLSTFSALLALCVVDTSKICDQIVKWLVQLDVFDVTSHECVTNDATFASG